MEASKTSLSGVILLRPKRFSDGRGFFSEVYNRAKMEGLGIFNVFLQDNHALSIERGVIRGLHFQTVPFAQTKLVRVARGSVLDVVVDIRQGSPTFGQHISVVLSAEAWNQLYVPTGFAHGYCTLEPNTEVLYKVDNAYSPEHDYGLLWNDPALGIDWPVTEGEAILSDKDRRQPRLAELPTYFSYEEPVGIAAEGG